MKKTAIAYWLIPAKPERELFRELIRILAKQFDAPSFKPHLTILVARADRQSPEKILQQIKASPVCLSVRGIGFSSKFTKTLFVRLQPSKSFHKLVADFRRVTKTRRKSVRDPHISLLYRKLPAPAKKELASTIRLPFGEIVFDSILAVRCISPTTTRADVESWRVLAMKRLSG